MNHESCLSTHYCWISFGICLGWFRGQKRFRVEMNLDSWIIAIDLFLSRLWVLPLCGTLSWLISISFKAFKLYFIVSPFIKKWETIIFGVFSILWVKRIRIELLFCHFNSSWQLIVMKEFWRSSTAEQSNSNLRFTHLSSRNLLRVILCDCQSSATGVLPCRPPTHASSHQWPSCN